MFWKIVHVGVGFPGKRVIYRSIIASDLIESSGNLQFVPISQPKAFSHTRFKCLQYFGS